MINFILGGIQIAKQRSAPQQVFDYYYCDDNFELFGICIDNALWAIGPMGNQSIV